MLRTNIRLERLPLRQLLQALKGGHPPGEQIALAASEETGIVGEVRCDFELFGLAWGRNEDRRFPFADQIQNCRIPRPAHTELRRTPHPKNRLGRRAVARPHVAVSALPTPGLARENHVFPRHLGQPTPQPFFHERPVRLGPTHHPDGHKRRLIVARRRPRRQMTQRSHIICTILRKRRMPQRPTQGRQSFKVRHPNLLKRHRPTPNGRPRRTSQGQGHRQMQLVRHENRRHSRRPHPVAIVGEHPIDIVCCGELGSPRAFLGDGAEETGHLAGDVQEVEPLGIRDVAAGLLMKGDVALGKPFAQPGQRRSPRGDMNRVSGVARGGNQRARAGGVPHAPVEHGEEDGLRLHSGAEVQYFCRVMGKGKLVKWQELAKFDRVFDPPLEDAIAGKDSPLKGKWSAEVFGNDQPIVLELGCGKGEYTIGQARRYPNRNFVGVDIKGHRFWRGAKISNEESILNAAFLRTRIEFIDRFFAPGEVDEIWLTFSDPQPKDEKGTKRITSEIFVEQRYKKFLKPGGTIHVKSDSPLLYELTKEGYERAGFDIRYASDDVYGELVHRVPDELRDLLEIKTFYEQMWLEEGRKIHYLQIVL